MNHCRHVLKISPSLKHSILDPQKWKCVDCGDKENVWACLQCEHVACGTYIEDHMKLHFLSTKHGIVFDVNEKYVYCYECENYILNDNAAGDIKILRGCLATLSATLSHDDDDDNVGQKESRRRSSRRSAGSGSLGNGLHGDVGGVENKEGAGLGNQGKEIAALIMRPEPGHSVDGFCYKDLWYNRYRVMADAFRKWKRSTKGVRERVDSFCLIDTSKPTNETSSIQSSSTTKSRSKQCKSSDKSLNVSQESNTTIASSTSSTAMPASKRLKSKSRSLDRQTFNTTIESSLSLSCKAESVVKKRAIKGRGIVIQEEKSRDLSAETTEKDKLVDTDSCQIRKRKFEICQEQGDKETRQTKSRSKQTNRNKGQLSKCQAESAAIGQKDIGQLEKQNVSQVSMGQDGTVGGLVSVAQSSPSKEQRLKRRSSGQLRVTGLRNLGNTCYMNSILQVLRHLCQFSKVFVGDDLSINNKTTPSGHTSSYSVQSQSGSSAGGRDNIKLICADGQGLDSTDGASNTEHYTSDLASKQVQNHCLLGSEAVSSENDFTDHSLRSKSSTYNENQAGMKQQIVQESSSINPCDNKTSVETSSATSLLVDSSGIKTEPGSGAVLAGDASPKRRRSARSRASMRTSLSEELDSLLRVMWSGELSLVSPHNMLNAVWNTIPFFKGYSQQDAQEFLSEFLDKVQSEIDGQMSGGGVGGAEVGGGDLVTKLFQGELVSQVRCLDCGNVSNQREAFMDLSLEFPDRYHSVGGAKGKSLVKSPDTKSSGKRKRSIPSSDSCNLEEMLEKFTKVEKLDGKIYSCDICNKRSTLKLDEIVGDIVAREFGEYNYCTNMCASDVHRKDHRNDCCLKESCHTSVPGVISNDLDNCSEDYVSAASSLAASPVIKKRRVCVNGTGSAVANGESDLMYLDELRSPVTSSSISNGISKPADGCMNNRDVPDVLLQKGVKCKNKSVAILNTDDSQSDECSFYEPNTDVLQYECKPAKKNLFGKSSNDSQNSEEFETIESQDTTSLSSYCSAASNLNNTECLSGCMLTCHTHDLQAFCVNSSTNICGAQQGGKLSLNGFRGLAHRCCLKLSGMDSISSVRQSISLQDCNKDESKTKLHNSMLTSSASLNNIHNENIGKLCESFKGRDTLKTNGTLEDVKRITKKRKSIESCDVVETRATRRKSSSRMNRDTQENSKIYTEAEKRFMISRLPRVLRLHLKRFMWSGQNNRGKISTHVNFPRVLDVTPYCDPSLQAAIADTPSLGLYNLSAVVMHHGRGFGSGHYTAYCWNDEADSWLHCNDDKIRPVNISDVYSAQAYILIYTKQLSFSSPQANNLHTLSLATNLQASQRATSLHASTELNNLHKSPAAFSPHTSQLSNTAAVRNSDSSSMKCCRTSGRFSSSKTSSDICDVPESLNNNILSEHAIISATQSGVRHSPRANIAVQLSNIMSPISSTECSELPNINTDLPMLLKCSKRFASKTDLRGFTADMHQLAVSSKRADNCAVESRNLRSRSLSPSLPSYPAGGTNALLSVLPNVELCELSNDPKLHSPSRCLRSSLSPAQKLCLQSTLGSPKLIPAHVSKSECTKANDIAANELPNLNISNSLVVVGSMKSTVSNSSEKILNASPSHSTRSHTQHESCEMIRSPSKSPRSKRKSLEISSESLSCDKSNDIFKSPASKSPRSRSCNNTPSKSSVSENVASNFSNAEEIGNECRSLPAKQLPRACSPRAPYPPNLTRLSNVFISKDAPDGSQASSLSHLKGSSIGNEKFTSNEVSTSNSASPDRRTSKCKSSVPVMGFLSFDNSLSTVNEASKSLENYADSDASASFDGSCQPDDLDKPVAEPTLNSNVKANTCSSDKNTTNVSQINGELETSQSRLSYVKSRLSDKIRNKMKQKQESSKTSVACVQIGNVKLNDVLVLEEQSAAPALNTLITPSYGKSFKKKVSAENTDKNIIVNGTQNDLVKQSKSQAKKSSKQEQQEENHKENQAGNMMVDCKKYTKKKRNSRAKGARNKSELLDNMITDVKSIGVTESVGEQTLSIINQGLRVGCRRSPRISGDMKDLTEKRGLKNEEKEAKSCEESNVKVRGESSKRVNRKSDMPNLDNSFHGINIGNLFNENNVPAVDTIVDSKISEVLSNGSNGTTTDNTCYNATEYVTGNDIYNDTVSNGISTSSNANTSSTANVTSAAISTGNNKRKSAGFKRGIDDIAKELREKVTRLSVDGRNEMESGGKKKSRSSNESGMAEVESVENPVKVVVKIKKVDMKRTPADRND